jgi:hypothetical protein
MLLALMLAILGSANAVIWLRSGVDDGTLIDPPSVAAWTYAMSSLLTSGMLMILVITTMFTVRMV